MTIPKLKDCGKEDGKLMSPTIPDQFKIADLV